MDLKVVKKILDMIADSDVNEVSIEEGDFKISVKKSAGVEQVTYTQPFAAPAAPQVAPAAPAQAATPATAPAPAATSGETVTAPIVGTFYQKPSPDSDPFAKVGDTVVKGQTICIIEAMKIMNEIEAEFGGVIKEILVTDGTPVEYEQPLFVIEKA